jgi:hypothetical protein
MGFLNKKTSWSNAEFAVFKLCIASIYLIVGSYYHRFFSNYYVPLLILFGITTVWTLYLWFHKMKNNNEG